MTLHLFSTWLLRMLPHLLSCSPCCACCAVQAKDDPDDLFVPALIQSMQVRPRNLLLLLGCLVGICPPNLLVLCCLVMAWPPKLLCLAPGCASQADVVFCTWMRPVKLLYLPGCCALYLGALPVLCI